MTVPPEKLRVDIRAYLIFFQWMSKLCHRESQENMRSTTSDVWDVFSHPFSLADAANLRLATTLS